MVGQLVGGYLENPSPRCFKKTLWVFPGVLPRSPWCSPWWCPLWCSPGAPQVAKTEGFAARLRSVQILVLDEVDQLASAAGFEGLGVGDGGKLVEVGIQVGVEVG